MITIFCCNKRSNRKKIILPDTNSVETDLIRAEELNKDLKPFGFAYYSPQNYFYSLIDGEPHKPGDSAFHDDTDGEDKSSSSIITDTESICFQYKGVQYLVIFRKGQYGLSTGAEVIFYSETEENACILVSFILRKNGNLVLTRSSWHWNLTAFQPGIFSQPEELTMEIRLELYSRRMAQIFKKILRKAGYSKKDCFVRGRTVSVCFSVPRTTCITGCSPLIKQIVQDNNQKLCRQYIQLTEDYSDPLDKLKNLRFHSPSLYRQILTLGKPVNFNQCQ